MLIVSGKFSRDVGIYTHNHGPSKCLILPETARLVFFIQTAVVLRQDLHLAHGVSWQVPTGLHVSKPSLQVHIAVLSSILQYMSLDMQSDVALHILASSSAARGECTQCQQQAKHRVQLQRRTFLVTLTGIQNRTGAKVKHGALAWTASECWLPYVSQSNRRLLDMIGTSCGNKGLKDGNATS
jgi:hypothetical protein